MDPLGLERLLKRVGLLHVGEEDTGELHTTVRLHLLDGEGEGPQHVLQETGASLRGEIGGDLGVLVAAGEAAT